MRIINAFYCSSKEQEGGRQSKKSSNMAMTRRPRTNSFSACNIMEQKEEERRGAAEGASPSKWSTMGKTKTKDLPLSKEYF